jgi:hypothetical protein
LDRLALLRVEVAALGIAFAGRLDIALRGSVLLPTLRSG